MSSSSTQPDAGGDGPQLLYINGEYRLSSDNSSFPVQNPMTGQTLYSCASATTDDYESAIEAAHAAFASWSTSSPSYRRLILLRAADILESYLERDASAILSAEVSAVPRWIVINIKDAAAILRESASLATHIKGEIVPADRPGTSILVERRPVGVVLGISPWNAPIILSTRAIATPLVCGNTVVLKPSEFTPKSQHLVVRALVEAGIPAGCINYLPTSPQRAPETTEYAVAHPRVLRINFTGSDRVGRIIAGLAAAQLKQVVLELGGKSPVVVLEDADIQPAANAILLGAFLNSGQICMSTERVLVHESIAEDFKARLVRGLETITHGNHLEEKVFMSGLCTPASAQRVVGMIQRSLASGARLLAGDLVISGPNKTILGPHIVEGVTPDMEIFQKETFGPVLIVNTFGTDQEAVDLANNSDFSLCASVFSKDTLRAMGVAKKIRAGSCHVNGPTVFIEPTLPNGGTGGSSGYGRFGGVAGTEEFTERKMISLAAPGMMRAI